MRIDLSESGCLTLVLSDEELAALDLSFDELDYQCPKTRRMLRSLLQLAQRELGFLPEGALLIEALPLDGGCLLLVSPDEGSLPPEHDGPAVFFVAEENALLQIAAAVHEDAHPLGESSSLYRGEDGFWLVVYGERVAPIIYECAAASLNGAAAAAFAAEHGVPIFIGDALPRLRRSL